jgi:hypothetical protein
MKEEAKEKLYSQLITTTLTLVTTLIGLYAGQYFSQYNAERMFILQHQLEMRELSYAKIMGLKVPWSQAIQTHLEAVILSDYYYALFQVLSHNPDDLAEAKRQNDRAINLIPTISNLQREVFENMGEIRICYKPTKELDKAIEDLYNFHSIIVPDIDRSKIKSINDLEQWKNLQTQQIIALCKTEYQDKIENILSHLLKQLRDNVN